MAGLEDSTRPTDLPTAHPAGALWAFASGQNPTHIPLRDSFGATTPSARKCNMLTLLRQRQNKVALFFAQFSLAAMLLLSPSYQGLTVLRLWWENGRYTPIT